MNMKNSAVVEFDERETVEPVSRDVHLEKLKQVLGEKEVERVRENSMGCGW